MQLRCAVKKELGDRTTSNFAWQLGAGCAWNITDTVALDLGYRFMSLGSAETAEETVSRPDGIGTISVQAQGKAENICMHQAGLGSRCDAGLWMKTVATEAVCEICVS